MTTDLADPPVDPPVEAEQTDEKPEDARDREPSTSTNGSKSEKPRKFRKLTAKLFNWEDTWSWEVGACILSAVCVVLLIGFLVFVDQTPYDSWRYQVSPNAIISVLVIVAKGTMLSSVSSCLGQLKWGGYQTPTPLYRLQALDQASRGPLGSFEVLYSMVPCLATAGALLTILSLAIDPFSQQILAFPSHRVPAVNESAFAQKAQEYWPSWSNMFSKNTYYDLLMSPLDPSMQLAMLSGLVGANSPLEPVCQSNDCTYPDFISLGVCSRCENVTSETKQSCMIPQPPNDLMLSYNLGAAPILCTYTTPQNFQIVPSVISVGSRSTPEGVIEILRMPFNATMSRNLTNTWYTSQLFGIISPIVSFAASKYLHLPRYSADNVTAVEDKPIITECTVYFCEKQYMNNSVTSNDRALSATRTQPLYPHYEEVLNPDNILISLNPPNGTKTLSDNATYFIDRDSLDSIGSQMDDLLNTSSSLTYEYGIFDTTSMFYSVEDLGTAMASLAESMTDNMRANPKATKIPGQAFLARTSIHVRWAWILVPAGSVFLAIGLLIATVNASRKGHAVLWKSSVLPLLISGLDTRSEHELRPLQRVSELHKLSRQTNVLLERVEGHPIFREH